MVLPAPRAHDRQRMPKDGIAMMYKGNDLDLRTPWRPSQDRMRPDAGYRPYAEAGRGVPISVDQTVLAASNGAYDAAVFFGTREVRPEHLLYAFTRVDAARDILEQHGLHTQQLRRETVAMMSATEPGAAWDGRGSPPAAPELEELLRRAAARAGQDGVAVSVQDVMRAALSGGREAGIAALFLHAAADAQSLERWAAEPALPLHLGAPQSLQLASLQQPDATEKLGARLDQVESAVRALVSALADIQQGIDGRIAEIGASIARLAERFDAVRAFSSDAPDVDGRLAALETRITAQPPAIAEAVSYMLGQRAGSEADALPASGAVVDRLASLEDTLRAQTERMDEVSKTHEHDLTEVYEALVKIGANQQTLAGNLETWRLDSGGDIGIVSNRVERMEKALLAVLPRPRPEPAPTVAEADVPPLRAMRAEREEDDGEQPTGSFKRWLFGTTRVLPSSWREDMTALRDSIARRRNGWGERT
jgi:hypothetical protein